MPHIPVVMHENLAAKIEEFKAMGIQFTFDGFAVADLLTQLDNLAVINYVEFKGSRLSIWLGDIKGTPKEVIGLIPTASLFGSMTSGAEDTPQGYILWFEWMLPKDLYYQKQV
jgi:hypothetical protein